MSNLIKNNIKKYAHIKYLLIIPVYLAIFCLDEKFLTDNYYVTHIPFDDLIPFCEWFIIPYFLWYPLMLGTGFYLFFRDVEGFKKYITYVGGGFLIIVILYAIFPNGQNLRPASFENSNIFTETIKILYQSDTNTNVCPSLHVVGTLAAMFALLVCKRLNYLWFKISIVFLALMISVSTVFIKQHSILDVFVGIAFGVVYYMIVYILLPNIKLNNRKRVLITTGQSQDD